jgi:tetratricopeptide (TPR) repeat protein
MTMIVVNPDWVAAGYAYREFTLVERVLTQARALADYVSNLLAPDGTGMGVFQDDYPRSRNLFSPISTLLSIVGWLLVLLAAWRYRETRARVLFFGPVFFLAGHALESTIFGLELYFEHRNYLPSFGIFLAMGVGAYHVFRLLPHKLLAILVLTLIPVGYAAACYQRVLNWQSPVRLLLATEQAHPESLRLQTELASLYANRKQLSKALDRLQRVEVLNGQTRSSGIALHRLLAHCASDVLLPEDEYVRLKAIRKFDDDNYTVNALARLARSVQKGRCAVFDVPTLAGILQSWWESAGESDEANRTWHLHLYTGQFLGFAGRTIEALAHLESARQLFPERLAPGLVAFQYQLELGDLEGARDTLQELKRRDNKKLYRYTEAIQSFDRLIATADEAARQAHAVGPP